MSGGDHWCYQGAWVRACCRRACRQYTLQYTLLPCRQYRAPPAWSSLRLVPEANLGMREAESRVMEKSTAEGQFCGHPNVDEA